MPGGALSLRSTSHDTPRRPKRAPAHEEHERKQRVLTHGTPSITRTIADAIVLKDGDLFLLAEPDGGVPVENEHGFGLYYHDCRYLDAYELQVASVHPVALGANVDSGSKGTFELTNPDLQVGGKTVIKKEGLSVTWHRTLDGQALTLTDRLTLRNWTHQPAELPVTLRFNAAFEDIFQVRGLLRERLGTPHPPEWDGRRLRFRYDGKDGVSRRLDVHFGADFERAGDREIGTTVRLDARGTAELTLELRIHESTAAAAAQTMPSYAIHAAVASDDDSVSRVFHRSVHDLNLLRSTMHGLDFYSAGIPWFATLFGRDSLITALQALPFQPAMAAQTLRLLARYQGTRADDWRDEQPGKILHEIRHGEMARAGLVPYTPYYGSVDATPLFLILLGEYVDWTGDLALFDELRPNAERALEWMRKHGDSDGDGYIEYRSESEHGLINQGWKDSGDAIVNADGDIATPPIALVEVQAYAYDARLRLAKLYRQRGDARTADELTREADALREQFNRDFWVASLGGYAMALAADKQPLAVVSSNPGHALWCGIADPDKAAATVERLMADDMFSGWGVRTLAVTAQAYTPIGYHLGTVWPHDNAIIAAGCRRYGFDDAAQRIFAGIIGAAREFRGGRLPELFTGFPRRVAEAPIRYPVACHPQAWAAGSVPFLLRTMLGLSADGAAHQLRISRPMLPEGADYLELRQLCVAGAPVSLRFARDGHRGIAVETIGSPLVEVIVEPDVQPAAMGSPATHDAGRQRPTGRRTR